MANGLVSSIEKPFAGVVGDNEDRMLLLPSVGCMVEAEISLVRLGKFAPQLRPATQDLVCKGDYFLCFGASPFR